MPGTCCAVGCYNRAADGFLMKRFPSDPERKQLWILQVNRDNWEPTASSVLCDAHFLPEMFESGRADGRRMLKPFAVPTLFDRSQPLIKARKPRTKRMKSPSPEIIVPVEEPSTSEPNDVLIIQDYYFEDEVLFEIGNLDGQNMEFLELET